MPIDGTTHPTPEVPFRAKEAKPLLSYGFSLFLGLLTACATAPKAPVAPVVPAEATESAAGEEQAGDADSDADGEREVAETDEPVATATEAPSTAQGRPVTLPTSTWGPCPPNMGLVVGEGVRVCVDKYEASLVETMPDGTEKPYPHWL